MLVRGWSEYFSRDISHSHIWQIVESNTAVLYGTGTQGSVRFISGLWSRMIPRGSGPDTKS